MTTTMHPAQTLTHLDREILAFERLTWRSPGAKEARIRERFGLSSMRYHQHLNALLDSPAALVAEPALVRRLTRVRDERRRRRRLAA